MDERRKRQSEVSSAGRNTEEEIVKLLNEDPLISNKLLIARYPKLPEEIKKRIDPLLTINYDCGSELIDADICVLDKNTMKLLAVISVKKSFRERGAQAAYWAVKIKQALKPFKYVLATPDVDKELFDPSKPNKKRKWRVILPCEFEKVFIYSYEGKKFKEGNLEVGKDYFKEWAKSLIRT
jgi:type II restriction enzyme